MIRVTKPEKVGAFEGYIKSQTAKALNRLLGREKQSVWCERYNGPVMVDAADILDKMAYIYLNPVKARLVDTPDEYPGLSSWKSFMSEERVKSVRLIKLKTIRKLKKLNMTYEEQMAELERLYSVNDEINPLCFSPYAVLEIFPELKNHSEESIKQQIIKKVEDGIELYKKQKPSVVGVKKLVEQSIAKPYISKRQGRRAAYICPQVDRRIRLLKWHKEQSRLARDAWQTYKEGGICDLPAGFLGPGGLCRAYLYNFLELDI